MSCWFNYKKILLFIGALTNKNFPYELRNWESEKIICFDPTESFGYNLKLLINCNHILQIEPSYSKGVLKHIFICNKSRYFFDGFKNLKYNNISFNIIKSIFNSLYKTLYFFELNYLKNKTTNFFYIFYENLSIDLLCLLSLFKYKYLFIKLKYILTKKLNNNIESGFLFTPIKFDNSNFCLVINTNIKFENIALSLKLKQRYFKGNFKLLSISSCLNLITDLNILGTNIKILKLINEGVHPLCQTILCKKNPCIIINSKLTKLNTNKFILCLLTNLKHYIYSLKLNTLNWSIYEPGINLINNLTNNYNKILVNYSIIYLINIHNLNYNFINCILNINLLYLTKQINLVLIKKMYLNQNYYFNHFYTCKIMYANCFYIPTKTLFENTEFFFNTEGLVKKSSKLFTNYKIKSGWKLLRVLFNQLNKKATNILNKKFNYLLNFNIKTKLNFLKLVFLLYLSKKIVNNVYITNNISSFVIHDTNIILCCYNKVKFLHFKLKFWLNDYYLDSKDSFSNNSLILIKYSKVTRLETTNFF